VRPEDREQVHEEINATIFERAVEISCEWTPTEDVGRFLKVAAQQMRLLELNAQLQTETDTREEARLAQNEESRRWRAALKAQRHRESPTTLAGMLQTPNARSNDGEVGMGGGNKGEERH
jgi:hypothetical protein